MDIYLRSLLLYNNMVEIFLHAAAAPDLVPASSFVICCSSSPSSLSTHSMEISIYRSGIAIEYGNFMTSIHPLSSIFLLCCIFKIPYFVIQHGEARKYSEIYTCIVTENRQKIF